MKNYVSDAFLGTLDYHRITRRERNELFLHSTPKKYGEMVANKKGKRK